MALPFLAACGPEGNASSASSPAERPTETRAVTLTLQVPSAGWTLEPVSAYRLSDAIWIVHQLRAPEGMSAQVISEVSDTIPLPTSDLPVQHYVLGRTWAWNANPEVHFIASVDSLQPQLRNAKPLPLSAAR